MYVPVKRTFSEFSATDPAEGDFEYWARYAARQREPMTWAKLIDFPMAIVLGEARSGKTEEFRQQAKRLRSESKAAFFIRLDELAGADVEHCLDIPAGDLRTWLESSEPGYFFLDSVDEARLVNPAALRTALAKVRRALATAFARAHVMVSSRISDWMYLSVREALADLHRSLREATRTSPSPDSGKVAERDAEDSAGNEAELAIYQIDPLDREGVLAIAKGLRATRPDDFWAAVVAGGYEAYARRPGDLDWLVRRWNQAGALGGLAELTEAAIQHRLQEMNETYVDSGAALAEDRLRQAAATLAAASVLSGRSQFQATNGPEDPALIQPADVLPTMTPLERQRVLGAAVFDAASLGRVRLHHRTVREYLAAEWVARELEAGLPLARAIQFFVGTPFGERVLIRSRRGALCWLAVRDARVREFVVRHFPEMVMFEGDPMRWAQAEAIEAFEGYLAKLAAGFWQDWWNDATEYARVARAIPPSVLIAAIEGYRTNTTVLAKLFAIIEHGEIQACADAIFALYRDATLPEKVRKRALRAMCDIASADHRTQIKQDLIAKRLADNDSRAAALVALGVDALSHAELVEMLKEASPTEAHQGDPLPETITRTLLPELRHDEALKLLCAIYEAVPQHERRELGTQHGEERKPFAWLLEFYGDVFRHVLATLPTDAAPTEELIECAVFAERLNHTQFMNRSDFAELRQLVAANPALRKAVALAVGLDAPNTRIFTDLTGFAGLVQIDRSDLDWVVVEALQPHDSPDVRRVWFLAAMELTYAAYRGRRREEALRALATGPDVADRAARLLDARRREAEGVKSRRNFRRRERERKAREAREMQGWAAWLRAVEAGIRNGTHISGLKELVNCARRHGGDFENVDPASVTPDLGAQMEEAFGEGLAKAYRVIEMPDLMRYIAENTVPWSGLIGMTSANYALRGGLDAAGAGEAEAVRAARFAVWSHHEPRKWVEEAAARHDVAIAADLMPVFEAELAQAPNDHYTRVVSFALKSPKPLRDIFLDRAVQLLRDGRVPSPDQQRTLCHALGDHPGAGPVIAEVAKARLAVAVTDMPPNLPGLWLTEWLRHDLVGAWTWLQTLIPARFPDDKALATALAAAAGDFDRWAKGMQPTPERVQALMEMFRFVVASFPLERAGGISEEPADRFLNRVPAIIQMCQTPAAHAALRELAMDHAGTHSGDWLAGLAEELAAAHAERDATIEPRDLRSAHDIFTRDARTEAELLEQVMARLEDIRTQIEMGPYSDRGLFDAGMDEEKLQIYLAARIDDTPVRHFATRYRVSREPEVDRGNKPDLEVTAAAGRVPIEVKPVDKTRYSATSLAGTLRDQIATKYLEHGGSRHAALVVINLESKAWEIPDGPRRGTFADLVAYLRREAEALRAHPHVGRIVVIGIDCVRLPGGPLEEAKNSLEVRP